MHSTFESLASNYVRENLPHANNIMEKLTLPRARGSIVSRIDGLQLGLIRYFLQFYNPARMCLFLAYPMKKTSHPGLHAHLQPWRKIGESLVSYPGLRFYLAAMHGEELGVFSLIPRPQILSCSHAWRRIGESLVSYPGLRFYLAAMHGEELGSL